MISYAERQVFSEREMFCWRRATHLVGALGAEVDLRCHELARAVGQRLSLRAVDGKCGSVEHSWLMTHGAYPKILDVYVPGAMPQVQLLDPFALLPWGGKYVPGEQRDDIRRPDIERLLLTWISKGVG